MAHAIELSFRSRSRNLDSLSRETVDVLVIGGGITGAGIARDAALRGLSVALVERRDFGCGTSSRSSKLIHGGLRYLQQGDVGLVMEAANERRVVRRLAPYLARPMHMLVPVYSRGGYAKINVGLLAYDRMAGVSKEERYRMLDRDETLAHEPALRADKLYGAGLYYEYVTDDARLVIATIKSAAALGAMVANYAEVIGFLTHGEQVTGVTVRDGQSGAELALHARVVVNAAGPWVDHVRLLYGRGEQRRLHLTKGIHVVVPHERLPVSRIVVMTTSDKRSVFVVPRGPTVYLGTTDTDYTGPFDNPQVGRDDVLYLLEAANATFTIEPLTFDDVVGAWAGLRPLLHEEGKKPSEISRKDEIMVSPGGLISIAGGKLTTFRKMAERIGAMAEARLREQGRPAPLRRGESEREIICGGDTGDDVAAYSARLQKRWPAVGPDIVERLVTLYGSEGERLVEAMGADPALRERCAPCAAITRGEVDYTIRTEMVLTLEDFLERRSRVMLYDIDNGLSAAARVAQCLGAALGWSDAQAAEALAHYQAHVREVKAFQPEAIAAPPPAGAAHG
ncbi:MAG: glycerol-3-phosphate dehydrogenase/oxidase [Deltaproteobacteria bacterium]|nr:glycerol-3-phosphate dehydrogenase/oxidase [Deltaproteobacteria bacterium]